MKDWEKALLSPFSENEVEWRVQNCGISANGKPWVMVLCYVTARACQNRLDEVFGMDGWSDTYEHKDNGVKCKLEFISPENGRIVAKENGAPETAVESFKGGFSKSFVRVCSNIGVGRYLYKLKESFAECCMDKKQGWNRAQTKDRKNIYWKTPTLPDWALPEILEVKDEGKNCDLTISEYLTAMKVDPAKAFDAMRSNLSLNINNNQTIETLNKQQQEYLNKNIEWFVQNCGL